MGELQHQVEPNDGKRAGCAYGSLALWRAVEIMASLTTIVVELGEDRGKGTELAKGLEFTTVSFVAKKAILPQISQISQYQKCKHQILTW